MSIIFHMAKQKAWEEAQRGGSYDHPSLDSEGFIHLSTKEQLIPIANSFYRGTKDFVLLVIESSRLKSELIYEKAEGQGDQLFPHLYGPLNVDAVVKALAFRPDSDGFFSFPNTA